MPLRAALFDLDGTLVDSLADIAAAMNHALIHHGLPTHPTSDYRYFVGEGVMHLIRRAAPQGDEALHTEIFTTYRAWYAEHLFDQTTVFPGIAQMLARLAGEGVQLAVLSNKADGFTKQLVKGLMPDVPFAAVYGERPGMPRKPDPTAALALAGELAVAPGDCAFVGDTSVDMNTARHAGMYGVGVTWGFRGVDELKAHGAQAIATTAEELWTALRGPREAR
ncbi:HAD family hydrolase [Stigmatella aurantiaca]|uniref:phosphoglycolate phosphatase n=2 Tax=Stigmatella aurantiaca (strain DW4/3-1) TaxID=378806 RepID=E3FDC2_STIAD|nr:HAD family hydrolase [Stigmatella aurantiaca]ADO68801.1 Phosphoglycolate phosphatase [Stigmatella aurantiaca DW4/3-1]